MCHVLGKNKIKMAEQLRVKKFKTAAHVKLQWFCLAGVTVCFPQCATEYVFLPHNSLVGRDFAPQVFMIKIDRQYLEREILTSQALNRMFSPTMKIIALRLFNLMTCMRRGMINRFWWSIWDLLQGPDLSVVTVLSSFRTVKQHNKNKTSCSYYYKQTKNQCPVSICCAWCSTKHIVQEVSFFKFDWIFDPIGMKIANIDYKVSTRLITLFSKHHLCIDRKSCWALL